MIEYLRAAVTDGVTLGHACCAVLNCEQLLPNNKARFCSEHEGTESSRCVIRGCRAPAEEDFKTCDAPTHRELENRRNDKGRSWFQLTGRMKQLYGRSNTGVDGDTGIEQSDEQAKITVPGTTAGQKKTVKVFGLFGRNRTNNEQLIVACCGVVLARKTMYGSENVSVVVVHEFLVFTIAPLFV